MLDYKTGNIRIDSACPDREIWVEWIVCGSSEPRAILQISHGMCEYSGRYQAFARFMADHGYAVILHDHLGHGKTSSLPGGLDGYFGPGRGGDYVLQDMASVNRLARSMWPGLPVILLGHSMGSFFARWFTVEYPNLMDGLLLSGTGAQNPLIGVGLALTDTISAVCGEKHRPSLVQKMAFGNYLRHIPHPNTPYDWISRDEQIVAAYAQDPKCTFVFTVSAFHELFRVLRRVNTEEWFASLPAALPVRLFSGDEDPVGDYGQGVCRIYRKLRQTGHKDVQMRLYKGARHEVLNEKGRGQVWEDVRRWCDEIVK